MFGCDVVKFMILSLSVTEEDAECTSATVELLFNLLGWHFCARWQQSITIWVILVAEISELIN